MIEDKFFVKGAVQEAFEEGLWENMLFEKMERDEDGYFILDESNISNDFDLDLLKDDDIWIEKFPGLATLAQALRVGTGVTLKQSGKKITPQAVQAVIVNTAKNPGASMNSVVNALKNPTKVKEAVNAVKNFRPSDIQRAANGIVRSSGITAPGATRGDKIRSGFKFWGEGMKLSGDPSSMTIGNIVSRASQMKPGTWGPKLKTATSAVRDKLPRSVPGSTKPKGNIKPNPSSAKPQPATNAPRQPAGGSPAGRSYVDRLKSGAWNMVPKSPKDAVLTALGLPKKVPTSKKGWAGAAGMGASTGYMGYGFLPESWREGVEDAAGAVYGAAKRGIPSYLGGGTKESEESEKPAWDPRLDPNIRGGHSGPIPPSKIEHQKKIDQQREEDIARSYTMYGGQNFDISTNPNIRGGHSGPIPKSKIEHQKKVDADRQKRIDQRTRVSPLSRDKDFQQHVRDTGGSSIETGQYHTKWEPKTKKYVKPAKVTSYKATPGSRSAAQETSSETSSSKPKQRSIFMGRSGETAHADQMKEGYKRTTQKLYKSDIRNIVKEAVLNNTMPELATSMPSTVSDMPVTVFNDSVRSLQDQQLPPVQTKEKGEKDELAGKITEAVVKKLMKEAPTATKQDVRAGIREGIQSASRMNRQPAPQPQSGVTHEMPQASGQEVQGVGQGVVGDFIWGWGGQLMDRIGRDKTMENMEFAEHPELKNANNEPLMMPINSDGSFWTEDQVSEFYDKHLEENPEARPQNWVPPNPKKNEKFNPQLQEHIEGG